MGSRLPPLPYRTAVPYALGVLALGLAALAFVAQPANAQCSGTSPPNDCFANPIAVTGVPFTDTQSTTSATTEPGEPAPCGLMSKTMWYEWTPAFSGTATIHTWGSTFDTVVAAYTGNSLAGLTLVSCNDDDFSPGGCNCLRSRIQFTCTAGTTYRIQAGGYSGSSGTEIVNVLGCDGAPTCSPATQSVPIGSTVTLTASGISPYTWNAPGSSNPGPVTGPTFTASYATMGTKTVTVSNSNGSAQCTVNVLPPPLCGYTVDPMIPYNPLDISPSGIAPGTGIAHNDDSILTLTLPFSFQFCGNAYTSLRLSSNGYLCLGSTGSGVSCTDYSPATGLPNTNNPRPAIFGYYTDLYPPGCVGGSTNCVWHNTVGTAPDRVFVYQFRNVPYCCSTSPLPVSFQIKLFEGTNCIEVHYENVSDPPGWHYIIGGYQDSTGGSAYTYAASTPGFVRSSQAWKACPEPPLRAIDDSFVLNEDQASVALDVLANDINPAPGPTIIAAITAPAKGTAVLAGNQIRYQPFADATGSDSFRYTIANSQDRVATGTIRIVINAVNDRPTMAIDHPPIVVTPDAGVQTVPGFAKLITPGPATATDEAQQAITFVIASNSNPAMFRSPPTLQRSNHPNATEPLLVPTSGGFAVLRFETGAAGRAELCFRAVDSGGQAIATNFMGEQAVGQDTSASACATIVQVGAPVAYFEATSASARPGQRVTFDPCPSPIPLCTHDPDGSIVLWMWEFGDGATSGLTHPSHSFPRAGTYSVRLTVWDDYGVKASFTRDVVVDWGAETPVGDGTIRSGPAADAGEDRTVLEGTSVSLVGTHGGPEGTRMEWTQVGGAWIPLQGADGPILSFMAPDLPTMEAVDLTFALRAWDGDVAGPADYVVVHVVSTNRAPRADAGPDAIVAPGTRTSLDATQSSDADKDTLTYRWEQQPVPGEVVVPLSDASVPQPTFTAPAVPTLLHFQLTVSDGEATSQDTVVIEVRPPPAPALEAAPPPARGDVRVGDAEAARPDWAPLVLLAGLLAAAGAATVAILLRRLR